MQDTHITARAFMWSRVLGMPFWVMLNTLSVILYKEFHVSPFLVTLLIALKPATALAATYWSCFFSGKNQNFILSNIIRFLPFLFFFLNDSVWFPIFCFSLYMSLSRGSMPIWLELFKNHLPNHTHSKLFALGNTFEYLGTTIFPIVIGMVLDANPNSWRWLFPVTALIGISSTLCLLRLPNAAPQIKPKSLSLPWKNSLTLIKTRSDFRNYLVGFMLGGAGLMIIQPVLPIFFVDDLQFSYTEMMIAITVCKGIGFAAASPLCVALFKRLPIHVFSCLVALLAACFPLLLFGAKWAYWLVYLAYLSYGMMQSGSELSWNLSSVTFSKKEESLSFSETNILAVGVRGCFIPFMGNFLFSAFNSLTVMIVGSVLCLSGALVLLKYKEGEKKVVV
jgi:hypothetical protein